jgi:hypothetical protein
MNHHRGNLICYICMNDGFVNISFRMYITQPFQMSHFCRDSTDFENSATALSVLVALNLHYSNFSSIYDIPVIKCNQGDLLWLGSCHAKEVRGRDNYPSSTSLPRKTPIYITVIKMMSICYERRSSGNNWWPTIFWHHMNCIENVTSNCWSQCFLCRPPWS